MIDKEKYYIEVNNVCGNVHEVDPDIPAWGTCGGTIYGPYTKDELRKEISYWKDRFEN